MDDLEKYGLVYRDFVNGRLDAFYRSCYPSVLTYTLRLLGGEQAFLAEDCVQDAIYRAYENRGNIATFQALLSYIYTSIYHEVVSIYRKRRSYDNYVDKQSETEAGYIPDFLDTLVEQETLDILFAAINSLPERLKRIFHLSFEEGLKNAEVAEILGVSESAVKKQKAQLVSTLRDSLNGRIDAEGMFLFVLFVDALLHSGSMEYVS